VTIQSEAGNVALQNGTAAGHDRGERRERADHQHARDQNSAPVFGGQGGSAGIVTVAAAGRRRGAC
jgi:hypothetical protein